MENSTKITLEKVKEAIKQADANIKFEEANINSQKTQEQNKIKTIKRGNNYDK